MPNPSKTRHGLVIDRGIKFMKKRLLITSIVMMLVVAVALSTATYAWFTSNNSVTASTVTMTAHVADASSISIGWESGAAGTLLTAVDGSALFPMCPVELAGTNANTVAFYRANVDSSNKFETPVAATPYTYTSSGSKDAFFINNDSPSQAVKIDVTAAIADVTTAALADEVVLNPGKTYYTWAETPASSGLYVATAIATNTYSNGTTTVAQAKTALTATAIYDRKPIGKYVRVAIFASTAQNTIGETLAKTAFTYKGLLGYGGNGSTADTAMGSISAGAAPSTVANGVASSSSVEVISSLAGNKAVYLVVKVWIDGQSFTQEEGLAQATVALTFAATNVAA